MEITQTDKIRLIKLMSHKETTEYIRSELKAIVERINNATKLIEESGIKEVLRGRT